ncbi:MAG: hypothetical protein WB767_02075 [Nocardioides sp.]
MADHLVLHAGLMKSGTSHLQALLFANQAHLADRGVLVPGETWADQAKAVRHALSTARGSRWWDSLVTQVREHSGVAVISMEYLGPAPAGRVRELLAQLGDPAVRVVFTARDLNRTLASMWQETVQNGHAWTWEQYVADVQAMAPTVRTGPLDRSTPGGAFWRRQGVARIVRTWCEVVGTEQVSFVTVPPPGAPGKVLAERFRDALGLDLDLTLEVPRSNESLGLASTLVLRRLNELLDQRGMVFPEGAHVRKHLLSKTVLAARRGEEPALGLPVSDWVRVEAAAATAKLQRLGVRLVGDWGDLDPVPVAGIDPQAIDQTAVTDAALHALASLVVEHVRSGVTHNSAPKGA